MASTPTIFEELRRRGLPHTPEDIARLHARARYLRHLGAGHPDYKPSDVMEYALNDYKESFLQEGLGLTSRPGEEGRFKK